MRKRIKRAAYAALAAGLSAMGALSETDLSGAEILALERELYALGYHSEACDEVYDDETELALCSFQIANNLEVTGAPDAETLSLIESGYAVGRHDYLIARTREYSGRPILQLGSSGDEVRTLQQELLTLGYFAGEVDGVFGEATQAAVRRFQLANGLKENGIADSSVMMRLYEGDPLGWKSFMEICAAKLGDEGVNVRLLQYTLKSLGYFDGEASGTFGTRTREAVSLFQANNGLEATGYADAETCDVLFWSDSVPMRSADTLYLGLTDERVTALQNRLTELGYFDGAADGTYDAVTETAVRLFQIVADLSSTGEADAETLQALDNAKPLEEAHDSLREQTRALDASAQTVIGGVAMRLRGTAFEAGEEACEGFAFVKYVCVASGVPVVELNDILEMFVQPVSSASDVQPGELMLLRVEDASDAEHRLAIGSGDGRVIYAWSDGWVLESDLGDLNVTEMLRWTPGAAQ